jgi:hypothetical protein
VPVVGESAALAGDAERLAGAATGPDGFVVRPPGKAQCPAPSPDPREEVGLADPGKVGGSEIPDVSPVDAPGRDVSRSLKVHQPIRRVRLDLVV